MFAVCVIVLGGAVCVQWAHSCFVVLMCHVMRMCCAVL
jgi:hypothetical protein